MRNVARTVAGKDEKLILISEIVLLNVGESSDDLGLGGELGDLFELEITNSAGEGKVAIDTAKVDETTGGGDAVLLGLELGLVVFGEGLCAALDTKDTAGVTGVGLFVLGTQVASSRVARDWGEIFNVPQRPCCRQSS